MLYLIAQDTLIKWHNIDKLVNFSVFHSTETGFEKRGLRRNVIKSKQFISVSS